MAGLAGVTALLMIPAAVTQFVAWAGAVIKALGDEHDFLAAKRLFEQELTERSGARIAASTATCSSVMGAARCDGQWTSTSRQCRSTRTQIRFSTSGCTPRLPWANGKTDHPLPRPCSRLAHGCARAARSSAFLLARHYGAASEIIDTGLGLPGPEDPFPHPGACTGGSRLWFPSLRLAFQKGHLAA